MSKWSEALKDVLKHKNAGDIKMSGIPTVSDFILSKCLANHSDREDIPDWILNAIDEYVEIKLASTNLEMMKTSKVTRVEVIDHSDTADPMPGRAWGKYGCKEVELQLQDDDRTLKIFIK